MQLPYPKTSALVRYLPLMAGGLAACIVLLLLESFVWLDHDRRLQAERSVLQGEAATVRARLESELNATLSLGLGLSAFVLSRPSFSEDELARVAASLIRLQPAISSVAIAPDNVIRYIYPRADNEKALGLSYMDMPAQRDAVLRLMHEQRPVIAGPLQLVQGGVGIVNRIPIVFTQLDGSPRYWGLVSVAIKPQSIFERSGIQPGGSRNDLRFALRGEDGKGAQGDVFLGDAALFDEPGTVLMDVIIPGGSWQLAVHSSHPRAGYGMVAHALILLLSIAAGALVAYSLLAHQRIRSMALHDPLTGLANRYQFNLRAQDIFSLAKRSGRPLSMLNIDIDDFKGINDAHGHAAGDAVLKEVADKLRTCCRESDLIARVGGDEFVVLLPDTPKSPALDALVHRLRATIHIVLPGSDTATKLGLSVGAVSCSGATPTLESLMHLADEAMYRAKEEPRQAA